MSKPLDLHGDVLPETAFRLLFHQYHEKLYRYAYTILKEQEEAKDAVQSIFTKLWENRRTIRLEEGIATYLYTATRHYCLNRERRSDVHKKYTAYKMNAGDNEAGDAIGKTLAGELKIRLKEALDTLPPQCRLVYELSRDEGKKYAEIAAELGISVKTVEAQMSKALRILREKLSDYLVTMLIFVFIS